MKVVERSDTFRAATTKGALDQMLEGLVVDIRLRTALDRLQAFSYFCVCF